MCNPEQLYRYMAARNSNLLILGSEVEDTHNNLIDIYNNTVKQFQLVNEFSFDNQNIKIYRLKSINENSKL